MEYTEEETVNEMGKKLWQKPWEWIGKELDREGTYGSWKEFLE